jgi:DNA-binding LacI/PurR family transcriptional regulator
MTKTRSEAITIRDVAREAGVSVATVSRFINQTAPVSEEVAVRLQKVMEEFRYVPQATARNLATHKTRTIGLLLVDIQGDFFAPLLNGIEAVTSEAGYDLLISCARSPQARRGFPLPLGPHNTDGVLIFADSLGDKSLAEFYSAKFPMVLIHRTPPEGLEIPCVTVENKAASRKIVEHLIEVHERRRIAFLRGPQEQEDANWREAGYRQALELHQLAYAPELVSVGEFDRAVAQASIQKMVHAGIQFDAVFTGDDEAAVGVLAALAEAGLRVPQDVAVVGFDDQRMSPYLTPPLTTVRAPTEEVGREAARQLVQILSGKEPNPATILMPTEIIIRRSCGCE